ncbi:MAG: (2Fe-2S) ferredoxin domain-containing protein [Terriglobia bacterium]
MKPIRDLSTYSALRGTGMAKLLPFHPRIAVGMGTCGAGNGAEAVFHAFADTIDKRGLDVQLARVGCFGFCAQEPLVNVRLPGRPLVILHRVQSNHVDEILDDVMMGNIPTSPALCKIEEWDHITAHKKCRSSKAKRRLFCAIAGSLTPMTWKSLRRPVAIFRSTTC